MVVVVVVVASNVPGYLKNGSARTKFMCSQ